MWSITITGRRMPLDIKPVETGNIVLGIRHQQPPLAKYQTNQQLAEAKAENPHARFYVSHFATCPEAKKWRKK
jgi:hypothetical protein